MKNVPANPIPLNFSAGSTAMSRYFSPTLSVVAVGLTIACSSVSDSDGSFWEPSRDIGGKQFGGFTPPTGAGGSNGSAGTTGGTGATGNTGSGGVAGDAGASGSGGVAGSGGVGGVGGVGGTVTGSGGEGGTNGGSGPGGTGGAGNAGGAGSAGMAGTGSLGTGGTGAGGSGPSTTCTLTFDYTTVTYRGRFGPKNIGAVWVMNSQNQFVKTLEVWAGIRVNNLVNWQRQTLANKVDVVSSATISNHRAHQARWDCRDATRNVVPNGQYKMFVEFTEDDSALFFNPQPKLFSFDFQKGAGPATISPPSQPNFTSMTLSIQ
jgi:hypothetical protein